MSWRAPSKTNSTCPKIFRDDPLRTEEMFIVYGNLYPIRPRVWCYFEIARIGKHLNFPKRWHIQACAQISDKLSIASFVGKSEARLMPIFLVRDNRDGFSFFFIKISLLTSLISWFHFDMNVVCMSFTAIL